MTEAVFTLFVASGLCLTFSCIAVIYAVRILQKAHDFLSFALELVDDAECGAPLKKEGTE